MSAPIVVVMGVSGSGKSAVGLGLADSLALRFVDADALHPPANVAKMASGVPLDDADRMPWLELVGATLAEARASGEGIVMACSALRRRYRDVIRRAAPDAIFVQLDGSRELLEARLRMRAGHFMPVGLLDSQLETLESLESDERGCVISIEPPLAEVVAAAEAGCGRLTH